MTLPCPVLVIEFNSALPIWFATTMAAAAIASVIYFYRGQEAVTGKGGIRLLMLLRLAVVIVAAVMLMAPGRVWTFQHHSRGRLYLVLDDTRSMSRIDPPRTKSRAALAEEALRRLRPTLDQFDVTRAGCLPSARGGIRQTWLGHGRSRR